MLTVYYLNAADCKQA